ncbi:5058_t:CDS:1, partial [Acaulospora colombiana]
NLVSKIVTFVKLVKASTTEHPADKVAWTLAYKPDLEQKGYGDDQSDTFTQMQRGSLSRSQSARSNGSSGSKFSLETSPSRQGVTIRPLSKDNIQPSIAQPIVANISLPQILGNDAGKRKSQASSIKPTAPPGLDAPPPPRKPNGALLTTSSLVIPTSRWSATTIGSSLPSTPAPVSATGVTMNGSRRSKAQQDVNQ